MGDNQGATVELDGVAAINDPVKNRVERQPTS